MMCKTDGSMTAATMKPSYWHSISCVHTTSKKHHGCVGLRECRKKCFMSAFEVTRITATAAVVATVCVSVVADGDYDGGD